jgi:hypothetical protein
VSLSLAMPGSAIREPIITQMTAIDVELERRSGWDYARKALKLPAPLDCSHFPGERGHTSLSKGSAAQDLANRAARCSGAPEEAGT